MKTKLILMAIIAACCANTYAGVFTSQVNYDPLAAVNITQLQRGSGGGPLTFQSEGVPLYHVLANPEYVSFIKGDYNAIMATFNQPVETFNFSASSFSGGPFNVYLLDEQQNYISALDFNPNSRLPFDSSNPTRSFQYDYSVALSANLGGIIFGASLDPILVKSYSFDVSPVPEPSSAIMLSLGIAGLAIYRRKKARKA